MQRDIYTYYDSMSLYEQLKSNPLNYNDPYGTYTDKNKKIPPDDKTGSDEEPAVPDHDPEECPGCPEGEEKSVFILGDVSSNVATEYLWSRRVQQAVNKAKKNGEKVEVYMDGVTREQMEAIAKDPCVKKVFIIAHSGQAEDEEDFPGFFGHPEDDMVFITPDDIEGWRGECHGPDSVTIRSCNQGTEGNRQAWEEAWGVDPEDLRAPDRYDRVIYGDPPAGEPRS